MDIVRIIAGESNNKYNRAAMVLRVLGWTSIIWGCMIAIWIGMGLKAGSDLWLYWTIAQFVVGAVLLAIAARLQLRAAQVAVDARVNDRAA